MHVLPGKHLCDPSLLGLTAAFLPGGMSGGTYIDGDHRYYPVPGRATSKSLQSEHLFASRGSTPGSAQSPPLRGREEPRDAH